MLTCQNLERKMSVYKKACLGLILPLGIALLMLVIFLATAVAQFPHSPPLPPTGSQPNIIFIIVDAVRADHLSAYGYAQATSPHLDAQLAAQGAIFTQATAPSAWTFPSNAGLFTGLRPSSLGVQWSASGTAIPDEATMLAEYLHQDGYYTAGFISAHYVRGQFGFNQGYDVYQELVGNAGTTTDAEAINSLAIDWIETTWAPVLSGTQPLFLHLYYYDPHTWYNPPAPYDTLYDSTYTGTVTGEVYGDGQNIVDGIIVPNERDIEHIQALYDGEITYWDTALGEMLDYLDSNGFLANSIIVLTSDHGQMFGEHGLWIHRNSLYEELLRVPLLVRYNGVISPGLVITTPIQTMDVMPTLLELANIPIPPNLESSSLMPLLTGESMTETWPVFSELNALRGDWISPEFEMRAVRQGDWKYIHQIGPVNANELYRLQPDSLYETDNLILTELEQTELLWQLLDDAYHLPTPQVYLPLTVR